jgi:hypothetical protein
MKKVFLYSIITTFILGSILTQTAFAATEYTLTVTNHLNDKIIIKLIEDTDDDDPAEYQIGVERFDQAKKDLPKDSYLYEYEACDRIYSGKLNLKKDINWEILPCGVEPTKMRLNSHFADNVTVTMYGPLEFQDPDEESFVVELGGNRISEILSGHYIMSYEAACSTVGTDPVTTFSEEVRVLKSGKTQITLHGCEWYTHPARTYDKPVPVKFKIINHASFPVILQIVGPQGALLDISPGTNLVNLIYGTYNYGYFLDGKYHTGNMMVTKNGLGQVILKPAHVLALPTTGADTDEGQ